MILMRIFLAALTGIMFASCASTPTSSGFPQFKNLSARNVALKMTGYEFTSGIDEQGKLTCNGIEMREIGWQASGFIVKSDGTIVTNFHVADKALQGEAQFDDGSTYKITQIKVYDPDHDLAVLKIKSSKTFPVVTLGNSDMVQPMDKVLAVGNPRGQGINVTDGKISQIKRNDSNVRILLRHTAPITAGNSGGALYRGQEVIGVNEQTWPGTQFHAAIPINLVKPLLTREYDRELPLQDVFILTQENISKKVKQVYSTTGSIDGSTTKDDPGTVAIPFYIKPFDDLYFELESDQKEDLGIIVLGEDRHPLGCGDSRGLLFSSENASGRVSIVVVNTSANPVRYGMNVYAITW